ncbi:hypothetical protein HF325_000692 [Metschnikowia pulcherrima]|uniref:Biotin-protein ligase N-terminal domain-containing protein n=1 Tax=Metschnikowia pulcherrima TaxID=27326 RepID=A0A8H7LF19_9ASCO|nr:hypothetical protein HF325_000692 [Metschnikowia pulcherrima]
MNVLVYAGRGSTTEGVRQTVELLRQHLSPYYAVVTVSEQALLHDPWQGKTAMLVMPGGADLPYCDVLNGNGNKRILQYVRSGGKFMGFCAGGYYALSRCEFEVGDPAMEVSGLRELAFFPGTCSGCVYKGFVYESHDGARAAKMTVNTAALDDTPDQVTTLARYNGPADLVDDLAEMAAAVYCKHGHGDVVLIGTHPEYAPQLMKPASEDVHFQKLVSELEAEDEGRRRFLAACLRKLGLNVNSDPALTVPRLTPIYVLAHLDPAKAERIVHDLRENMDFVGPNTFEDVNDTFVIHDETEDDTVMLAGDAGNSLENLAASEKHVKFFTSLALPPVRSTPYFDMQHYFTQLQQLYAANGVPEHERAFGSVLCYSEVVTLTNTLLDANPNWLRYLPTGLTFTATTQVAGRGRGGNVWVNPKGVMATSVLFRVAQDAQKNFNIYFSSLADKNDTSLTVDGDEQKWAKVSGALVNSQFINGEFYLVWGCGINVLNEAPTTSINNVLRRLNEIRALKNLPPLEEYDHETLLAKIVYNLGQFYSVFQRLGLKPFLSLYYKRWFHLNQRVGLDAEGNGNRRQCVIKGITSDYGLLVAEDVQTHETLELQPDGNSFDIFKGLVYKKR